MPLYTKGHFGTNFIFNYFNCFTFFTFLEDLFALTVSFVIVGLVNAFEDDFAVFGFIR